MGKDRGRCAKGKKERNKDHRSKVKPQSGILCTLIFIKTDYQVEKNHKQNTCSPVIV